MQNKKVEEAIERLHPYQFCVDTTILIEACRNYEAQLAAVDEVLQWQGTGEGRVGRITRLEGLKDA